MTAEVWKVIPDTDGLYQVSDQGRVRSFQPRWLSSRILATPVNNHGYRSVTLCVGGTKLNRRVHQLVTSAFIGPRPAGLVIRHLDGDKLNNRADNLLYGTASEKAQDTLEHGAHPQLQKTHCPSGHAYDTENTRVVVRSSGLVSRRCRSCHRKAEAARVSARRTRSVA